MKVDCTKCRFRKVCKIAGDPWDLKHGGDEKGWCPIAQDAVDGKVTGREIAISGLRLSPGGETNLLSKKMDWQHPVNNTTWTRARKIRFLMDHQYSNDEICETLGIGDKVNYISKVRRRREDKKRQSQNSVKKIIAKDNK
jgi:hypothetical protein